jgi:hypothetical protein
MTMVGDNVVEVICDVRVGGTFDGAGEVIGSFEVGAGIDSGRAISCVEGERAVVEAEGAIDVSKATSALRGLKNEEEEKEEVANDVSWATVY